MLSKQRLLYRVFFVFDCIIRTGIGAFGRRRRDVCFLTFIVVPIIIRRRRRRRRRRLRCRHQHQLFLQQLILRLHVFHPFLENPLASRHRFLAHLY